MNPMQHPERSLTPPEPQGIEPDESDLKEARGELAKLVSAGKTVGRVDLAYCIEAENNADSVSFEADVCTLLLLSICKDNGSCAAFWLRAVAYVERIAAKHLSDDDVLDRAVANLNERDE